MKNILLTFALVLTVSFAFAENEVEKTSIVEVEENSTFNESIKTINFENNINNYQTVIKTILNKDGFCETLHIVKFKGETIIEFWEEGGDCGVVFHML